MSITQVRLVHFSASVFLFETFVIANFLKRVETFVTYAKFQESFHRTKILNFKWLKHRRNCLGFGR